MNSALRVLLGAALGVVLPGCHRSAPSPTVTPGGSGVRFCDVAAERGIRFPMGHGGRTPLTILETLGQGCAFLDYDGDGFSDVFVVSDRTSALFRNRGDGRFEDVSATSRAAVPGYWHGVGVADIDGDGRPDLCLVGYHALALLRNTGHGFENVTARSGLTTPLWGSSCGFADLDGDGRPDLVIGDYVEFGPKSVQFCTVGSVRTACGPKIYTARHPQVYRNLGGGRFRNVTADWGFASSSGKALGIQFGDFNGDGKLDVAIANDEMPLDLFLRDPGSRTHFTNRAVERGFAYLASGAVQSAMGIDAADWAGSGREGLITTNFQNEPSGLYRNDGDFMTDVATGSGVGEPTFPYVGWGVRFLDADLDGALDLIIANGHIQDNVYLTSAGTTYKEPLLMLMNDGHGQFRSMGAAAGEPFTGRYAGRGLATGDFDNDGHEDVLVADIEGEPLLLHNESSTPNHWLGVEAMEGNPPRPALGALVTVEYGGRRAARRVGTCGSIFSAQEPRLRFGLGNASSVTRILVEWPDGTKQEFSAGRVDRYVQLIHATASRRPSAN